MYQSSSNIFEGFKSLGHVTGPLPFIIRHANNPKDIRIISIVGRTFHTYTLNGTLVEVSIPHEHPIKALIADQKFIYSASGRSVLIWGRGSKKLVQRLDRGHEADIHLITKFGNSRIISIDEDNVLFNWNIQTDDKEILNIIQFDLNTFKITTILHPFEYKDKILIASEQGTLELWNIVHEECLYKFNGWNSPVRCLLQSPDLDVVAIGLEDGSIHIHNLRYDESIMKMVQDYGPVTSMSFRLDGLPYLVSASDKGHLSVWNCERKRISTQIRDAHLGRITCCRFVKNQSLLVTSGEDNSLKIWTLDMSDGGGNLLSQRSGHVGPPSYIRFYGDKGFHVLSAGHDSTLKCFHLLSERLNRNFGFARLNPEKRSGSKSEDRRLPPIINFSAESIKEKEWDNIVACHAGSNIVSTWNYDKCKMGKHLIEQPTFTNHEVFAERTCISPCGNFLVIGFSNGFIFKYNIQSGIFRLTFESPDSVEHKAHYEAISGLCVDALSLLLISSSIDGHLKIWNFRTGNLTRTLNLGICITHTQIHRDNNLLALALDGGHLKIMELDTYTFVRVFEGISSILDMTFSPDAQWLTTSHEDNSIRTWDLYLGKLIDAFALSSACLSLCYSSTGEFLATAHAESPGIMIWSNLTLYVPTPVRVIDIFSKVPVLDVPHVCCDEKAEGEEEEHIGDALVSYENDIESLYISPEQLQKHMIELSGLPSSRWKNLLRVGEIRQQQHIEEQKKRDNHKRAPFFLPMINGLKPQLDKEYIAQSDNIEDISKLDSRIKHLNLMTSFAQTLIKCHNTKDFILVIDQLKQLGPSATDAEISSLGIATCNSMIPLLSLLEAIEFLFDSNRDFELAASWLALCLKTHSDDIEREPELTDKCVHLKKLFENRWTRLKTKFVQAFSVMNFVKSSVL